MDINIEKPRYNLGVLVKTLGPFHQGIVLIHELNKLVESYDINVTVFYEEYDRIPICVNFPIMQNRYAWDYNGILFSTDVDTTHLLINLIGPQKRIFYMWNLDWLYTGHDFLYLNKAYMDESIELAIRDESVQDIVTKIWRKPTYIIGDFNHEELASIVIENCEKN